LFDTKKILNNNRIIIEEVPSPFLYDIIIDEIGHSAIEIAKKYGYS
jgi:acetyl/propionyl-CoA carboxylase alpha subunit